jgi:hypothetical protein
LNVLAPKLERGPLFCGVARSVVDASDASLVAADVTLVPPDNITGFTFVEFTMVGKWLEMLKEMSPDKTIRRDFAAWTSCVVIVEEGYLIII